MRVSLLPSGYDPDSFLKEFGKAKLLEKLEASFDYLTFQFQSLAASLDLNTPAQKNTSELLHWLSRSEGGKKRSWSMRA